ncbi:hypothetical protein Sjap_026060 [Stephania japonica]|uniref:Uncharacterized protein n=1 Tax=Stephania japonica TaxID=461633 RepID=A0AAP0HG58_9MAGN
MCLETHIYKQRLNEDRVMQKRDADCYTTIQSCPFNLGIRANRVDKENNLSGPGPPPPPPPTRAQNTCIPLSSRDNCRAILG